MSKHARDYSPFQSVSAYVVLRPDKQQTEVALVQAYHGSGGLCVVSVYNYGDGNPQATADESPYRSDDWKPNRHSGKVLDYMPYQSGRAGGYGYDKFTAALSGLVIDGHCLTNHCGGRIEPPKDRGTFPRDYQPPKGYRLANWIAEDRTDQYGDQVTQPGWLSCYRLEGLKYLEDIGYRVICAA